MDFTKSSYSPTGSAMELMGGGSQDYVSWNRGYGVGSGIALATGTSFAAPMAAGVARLVAAYDGTIYEADKLRARLQMYARDLGEPGWDPVYGYGAADAYCAAYQVSPCQ